MSVVEFVPKKPIDPLFAIKLPPAVSKICESFQEPELEDVLKKALKISEERLVHLKTVEDLKGNLGIIFIIYDYKYRLKKPKISIPQTENGFFNFRIYEIDFNKDIDLEKFIKAEKDYQNRDY